MSVSEGFKPELKLELLKEIKKVVNVPLVLHGGSGNPDKEIGEAAKLGINKINISSDIKDALYQKLRVVLANDPKVKRAVRTVSGSSGSNERGCSS